jgi:hypothetical protein
MGAKERHVAPIRILLADLPQLMTDLLADTLSREPDMTLTRESDADVVVLGMASGEMPGAALAILLEHPRAKVLGVETASGEGHLFELRPHRTRVSALTPATIAAVIRAAAARPLTLDERAG